jgi:hypothetical protein
VLTLAVALFAVPVALAVKLTAPSKARVGDSVTAKASGVNPGRYALTLSLDDSGGPRTACVARVAGLKRAVKGKVTLTGTIPAKLQCWENNKVKLGRVKVKPGAYHLIVAKPFGPSGFSGKQHSFVRRALTIRG